MRLLITVLAISWMTFSVVGVTTQVKNTGWPRLDQTKPTVYIEFKGLVKADSSNSDAASQKIQFLLYNNTTWRIYYYLEPRSSKQDEATLVYGVEGDKGESVYQASGGHIMLTQLLPGGESASFFVPREHLAKGNRIYVEFNYEWEARDGSLTRATEPTHRVYFSRVKLPAYLRD